MVVLSLGSSCIRRGPHAADVGRFELPGSYAAKGVSNEPAGCWWTRFERPALNALIDTALTNNFNVLRAWARLDQAAALARRLGAAQVPHVDVEGSGQRARTASSGEPVTSTAWSLGLAAAYEVDLWGRVAAVARAAGQDALAAREDVETAAMSVAAETAEGYLLLQQYTLTLALLEAQWKTSQDYTQLTEYRFAQGLSSALDVYQQRQQEGALYALMPGVESQRRTMLHALAVLVGRAPEGFEVAADDLPGVPPMPELGLPADLLTRRPDVRAALARMRAADERAYAALADRLPALRLSAGIGYGAAPASTLFDNWVAQLAGNLVMPLIDGGQRRAEVERARAEAREDWLAAGQTVLTALKEVEDALVQEALQQETLRRLRDQLEAASLSLRHSRERYLNGLTEYLNVLLALDRLQALQRQEIAARRERLTYRVRLYRALGGDWTREMKPPQSEQTS